ncbi:MAG: OmpA family protein [bacterium]|nr:OmpA family protein [bacterium]
MAKVIFLLISLLLSWSSLSQHTVGKDGENMNSCIGAINIFDNGEFKLAFNGGGDGITEAYPALSEISSENTLWCSYIAPSAGTLTFDASVSKGYLQMVVFKPESDDICRDVEKGIAEIQRMHVSKEHATVGLSGEVDQSHLYKYKMSSGQKIYIVFATDEESEKKMSLNWNFDEEVVLVEEKKVVDVRDDDFAPTLSFSIRDSESGMPLTAALILEGNRDIQGMYVGSDFFFNITSTKDFNLSCDLEGYFFYDSLIEISAYEDRYIEIFLDRAESGKSLQIEEIQFVPGTSEILKSSEPKLRRLKDFLALNSTLEVEIQGHVFAMGDNSFAGQKISEARAKRVMHYLIDNGIDKDRLSFVGYGNTRPIYENPLRTYQEQANRRVEILIK